MADITFGPFTIDVASNRLLRDGSEVRMRPQAFLALRALAAHGGRLVDGDQLIREAWGGTSVSRHTVHVTLAEVRRCLADSPSSSAPSTKVSEASTLCASIHCSTVSAVMRALHPCSSAT